MTASCFMMFTCFTILFFTLGTAVAQKRINVSYNRNVEIINLLAVQNTPNLLRDTLTNPWLMENSVLMRQSSRQFSPALQHPIFRTYQRLEDSLGTGTYLLGLYYSEVPHARRYANLPTVFTKAISPDHDSVMREIDNFFEQLNRFYKDINFDQFLADNAHVYREAKIEINRNLPESAFISTMERYYGVDKRSYNLIINPFFQSRWGMGWEVLTNKGLDIYNIASPFNKAVLARNGRIISPGFDNREEIRRLSVHEFGHSFVNPVADLPKYRVQIEQFNNLYAPIKGQEQYDNWHTQFCEYVVRAGEVRIALAMNDPTAAKATETRNTKWHYLSHFTNQLERYERNRAKYPTFEAFFPDLITSLDALNK